MNARVGASSGDDAQPLFAGPKGLFDLFMQVFADNIRVLLEKPVDDTLIMIIEPMSLTVEDEGLPEGEFL